MIAIVISACLIGDPGVCQKYRIPLAYGVDTNTCMFEAQPHFARWAAEHPRWQIMRWHCTSANIEDL